MALHATVAAVTERIAARSAHLRKDYLERMRRAREEGPHRVRLSCGNLAHVAAASTASEKRALARGQGGNLGVITAYNDMLSAHRPFERYPALIRAAAEAAGGTAQVAGGVPAMCDGVTQGQPGMELSLFSRDVIAMAAAVGLTHNAFDAALFLGVCDKIVPGMVMAAASFGHLPAVFIPAGPMTSGLPNDEKSRVRREYAKGAIDRKALMAAEMASYHGPGTCTFYGTANTNQMLMEIMGLHLPGGSFVNAETPLRDALTTASTERALQITALGNAYTPVCDILDARAFVNGVVGLHATGGSTNHTIHLIAMARAAGLILTWEDMAELSAVTPLMARVYPNGVADVNHFHAAGGLGYLIGELLAAGLLHDDTTTVMGQGLAAYTQEPQLTEDGGLTWVPGGTESLNTGILRSASEPFQATGGLAQLKGPLGTGVIKISAVAPERQVIEAPVRIFEDQASVKAAFEAGELDRDVIVVVRFQGPKANGMPELHGLTPVLGVVQERGHKVALVTDGRMSGASGSVPAAIHMSPEALDGGPLARLQDGDVVRLDATAGRLELVDRPADFETRPLATPGSADGETGFGRELFANFRARVTPAETGALSIAFPGDAP